jgi:hypothetical protein
MTCPLYGFSDENKHFDRVEKENYIVFYPLFETNELNDIKPNATFSLELKPLKEMMKAITSQILSPEEIKQLNRENKSILTVFFNYKGEIAYIYFILRSGDSELFTDQKLFNLYQLIKTHGLDMSKGEYVDKNPTMKDSEYRFATSFALFDFD